MEKLNKKGKQMTQIEFKTILQQHEKWLMDKTKGQRADFSHEDLTKFNFKNVDLTGAIFIGANLTNVDFTDADFSYADFSYAILINVNFTNAKLHGGNFTNANLKGAIFSYADFSYVNFSYAVLNDVNFEHAILYHAELTNAILKLQCPEEGAFVGYKKCQNNVIVKLLIMEDALRSSSITKKCRASKVKILNIFNAYEAKSIYNENFIYHDGDIKEIPDFDKERWNECSTGIHFFLTKKEAENYQIDA